MLNAENHGRDCALLGIEAGLSLREVELAWQNIQQLYAEDSLATYGLLDSAMRQERLGELKTAYDRIIQRLARSTPGPPVTAGDKQEVRLPPLTELSRSDSIGQSLRQLRERSGLTLRDIAERTKISSMRLDQIEQDMYERLPEAVYLRGFVLEYAKILGFCQPQEVAHIYLSRCMKKAEPPL
ncbi:MAG: helix-turn-helix domain-containing protein [Syntrophotaleaceae bacterium]